jgi:hypothetical protein
MPNMPSHDDANLILRLYELRREDRMRQARSWFISSFTFKTLEEFDKVCPFGSDENASCRMVITYWEMVGSFLNSEVLDRELFYKSGNELLFVYLRIMDLIPPLRERHKDPTLYGEIEQAAHAMIEWKKSRAPEGFAVFSARVRGA